MPMMAKVGVHVSESDEQDRSRVSGPALKQGEDPSREFETKLLFDIGEDQRPILYSPKYDINFFGLEKLHPFDVTKWGRAHQMLLDDGIIKPGQTVEPKEAQKSDLLRVHTPAYLKSLKSGVTCANIAEVCPILMVPSCLRDSKLLRPLRYQTGGTVLGTKLALERSWAINLGGGFHHCSSGRGGGFCYYADVSLSVKFALDYPQVSRVMIVDLDAHQGNGHEQDWGKDQRVFILDAYNDSIYPQDAVAKRGIRCPVPLRSYTSDQRYLELVEGQLKVSLENFPPHLVIYNAGTDVLDGDPLGRLSISANGIVQRDLLVFRECMKRQVPILMLTSGGYQPSTAGVIAASVGNLCRNSMISF